MTAAREKGVDPTMHTLQDIPLDDGLVEGAYPPLLPEGEYLATYTHHWTAWVFNTAKVFVHFKLVEQGEHYGKQLYRPYRAKELIGKAGKNGRFKLAPRSDLYLMVCRLYEPQVRPDRISLRCLKDVLLRVSIRTVRKDSKQRPLPACLHYSVVDELVCIEAGNPT